MEKKKADTRVGFQKLSEIRGTLRSVAKRIDRLEIQIEENEQRLLKCVEMRAKEETTLRETEDLLMK